MHGPWQEKCKETRAKGTLFRISFWSHFIRTVFYNSLWYPELTTNITYRSKETPFEVDAEGGLGPQNQHSIHFFFYIPNKFDWFGVLNFLITKIFKYWILKWSRKSIKLLISTPRRSLQDVTEALLLMCNSRLQPPLFSRLYNAAKQLSLTTGVGTAMYDKKTHMYHIQQVLEQLPPHRYILLLSLSFFSNRYIIF
jgi:hypothetical protein